MRQHWTGLSPEIRDCRLRPAGERDRCYLELMAVAAFKSGLNYRTVNAKWDDIRKAFHDFVPSEVAAMTGKEIERLESDPRVIRSAAKIRAVVQNARRMLEIEAGYGGFAEWLDTMPEPETKMAELHRNFAFMGPAMAYYFLHYAGEDVPGWHEWAEKHPEILGRRHAAAGH